MFFQSVHLIGLTIVFLLLNLLSTNQLQKSSGIFDEKGKPMSGTEIFKWYCAACHGKEGKGNGPAASELKVPPPDLTTLSKRNRGKFPADYVTNVLLNGAKAPAHGRAEMPIWGPLFAELNSKGKVSVQITDIVHYLESIQAR